MECEFDYCIYNNEYVCSLKNIVINGYGMCRECILVSISDTDLKKLKERQLKNMEE